MKNLLFLFFIFVSLQKISAIIYGNNPKLLVQDGHLKIASAVDKNITIRLKGKATFNINNIDLLKLLGDANNLIYNSNDANLNEETVSALRVQVLEIKSFVYSPNGLLKRINDLENRTIFRIDRRTLTNINRRIRTLEGKVNRITRNLSVDNCRNYPCLNGGTCINVFDGFFCECPKNWEGPTCSVDVNECALFSGTDLGCQNGAQCVNTPGSYNCICNAGWLGTHCTRKSGDCLRSPPGELCGHGVCINANNEIGYACICEQGWKTNGLTPACNTDIDECTESKPTCVSSCINLPGSFMCGPCPNGFTGNGHVCRDIDECAENNGGCSNSPVVNCINSHGSYRCGNCPIGWTGDGKTCTRISGQTCSRHNICHRLASCREMSNTVICTCPPYMTGTGYGPNGCVTVQRNPCRFSPCQNGGTCVANGTSFNCICPPGFNLPFCRGTDDPCVPNPCENSGQCTAVAGYRRYSCICTSGFRGRNCQYSRRSCGGVLTDESGVLKYPLVRTYMPNIRCAWLIQTNTSKVLNVTFTKFDLEPSAGCFFDWLQINDGRSSAAHLIGRFCGNDLPKGGNIISTQNTLYLWFRSENSSSRDGFELKWNSIQPVCGGEITVENHGTISSPGSPGNYPPNRDCTWTLTAPMGKRIQIIFFTMKLEVHETCQYDYLSIYDGLTTTGTPIGQYCNTSHPPPLLSPSNEVTMQFHSDEDGSDAGFQIHYSVVNGIPDCGGVFTANNGEFGSPIENGAYAHNLACDYLIQVPIGSKIQLKFLNFNLEESEGCTFDFLEIFDGKDELAPKVGTFCGETIPDYKSTSNMLYLKFRTDSSRTFEGFRVQYKLACGETFQEDNGVITSPLYPNPYINNHVCEFIIDAPSAKSIKLNFIDFDIEGSSSSECTFDHLQIYDGLEMNSTNVYCGDRIPPEFISTHNSIKLILTTDVSISGRGFKLNYTFVDRDCGGILKASEGFIKPPMNRENLETYLDNMYCTWIIAAPPGYVIQLSFLQFNLEQTSDCLYDYVEIYDGSSSIADGKVGRYCGSNEPPKIVSSQNFLTIVFKSDSSQSNEGFTATYFTMNAKKFCGGNYFALSGVIRSPGWPDEYMVDKDCEWIIRAPLGKQIELLVKNFTLESQDDCNHDYLEIRNGNNKDSPLIGKYCGTSIPNRIPSFANQIFLKFHSDSSARYAGFEILWDGNSMGCGGTLTAPSGSISSPNYPEPYDHRAQCDWRIIINKGSKIRIIISEMSLESSSSCSFDYLDIYDGSDPSSEFLGKYCTSTIPIYIMSTTNEVYMRMVTDESNAGKGFLLHYSYECNNQLTDRFGVIESPNYPDLYPNSLSCEWKITATLGNTIEWMFSHLDVEDSGETCVYDYVQYEDVNSKGVILKNDTFCKNIPPKMNTTGNSLVIRFKTDISAKGSGFRIEYQVVGCGGIIQAESGELKSPNYPAKYNNNVECDWVLLAEHGKNVELTILDLDIEHSGSCDFDGLLVANGRNSTHTIAKYCDTNSTSNITVISGGSEMFLRFYTDSYYTGRGFHATYRSVTAKCGATLRNTRKGSIYSPNYPKNYDINSNCEWLVQVESWHSINITIIDFDLEESTDCVHDYVEIYDGSERNVNTLIFKGCRLSDANATSWVTKSSEFLIVFISDDSVNYKGFQVNFQQNCGKTIITNSTGVISPTSQQRLRGECTWTIRAAKLEQHITFITTDFQENMYIRDNEFSTCKDSITFYDGDSENSPIKHKTCTDHPLPITSNGNALTIKVDLSKLAEFAGYYSVFDNACGGVFKSQKGKFASPLYPDSYPVNVECIWEIVAKEGFQIDLNIAEFDIDNSEHCNNDYLEVREGNSEGKLLGIFCGKNVPSQLLAQTSMWIKFRSDDNDVGKGFTAQFNYASENEISGTRGSICSPDYPFFRSYSGVFKWRIVVPRGNVIGVKFTDVDFKAEEYVQFFNGYDETATKIEISDDSESFNTDTSVLFVKARRVTFKLDWIAIPKSELNVTNNETLSDCQNNIITIGGGQRIITSPGYPYGYKSNLNCSWILQSGDETAHAEAIILTLDLKNDYGCYSDYVKISKSSDLLTWKNIEKVCTVNITNPTTYIGSPYLKIVFISDYNENKTGFSIMTKSVCGGNISSLTGLINGSKYIARENFNKPCIWRITGKRGWKIHLTFTEMNLPKTSSGICDSYVLLRNGIDEESPILGLGKYCGTSKITIPLTSSNKAYITYNIGDMLRGSWILRYSQAREHCGENLVLTDDNNQTVITSPNYPNIPVPHTECVWVVSAPVGERIKIDFIDQFDLGTNCDIEYVEIQDGGTSVAQLVGRYCKIHPNTIFSNGNIVRIKFFTDTVDPHHGFKAVLNIEKCGGTFRDQEGTITSINYPIGGYLSNTECNYTIVRPIGTTINITCDDISLPSDLKCDTVDNLRIFEVRRIGDDVQYNLLRTLCGSYLTPQVIVESNEALLQFTTFTPNTIYRGFKISYKSSGKKCGGTIESESGFLTSPGYPNAWEGRGVCRWIIVVPKGRRIKIQFIEMNINIQTTTNYMSLSNTNYMSLSRIRFYNDKKFFSRINTTLWEQDTSLPIYSSDNVILIYAIIQTNTENRGFKLQYSSDTQAICRGSLDDSTGIITSLTNVTSYYCIYETNIEANTTLALKISNLLIHPVGGTLCYFRNVISLRADDLDFELMLCSNITEQLINLPPTKVILYLSSTERLRTLNFVMVYKRNQCGGHINLISELTINSTVFADNYGVIDCAWVITSINAEFLHVSLAGIVNLKLDCTKEYIVLRAGKTTQSVLLGERICGQKTIPKIASKSNLYIEYHSDNYNRDSNFSLMLTASGECGGFITEPLRKIVFNDEYKNNVECIWNIQTYSGHHIGLKFIDRFFIEKSDGCTKDYLEIRDKIDDEWKSIGRVCGRDNPPVINSTGSQMQLIFRSDDSTLGDGFTIQSYSNCGGIYKVENERKRITSPNYPHQYMPLLNCNYTFVSDTTNMMYFKFHDMDFEGQDRNCYSDNLTIYQKHPRSSVIELLKVGTYCNAKTINEYRQKEFVSIIFKTDALVEGRGFLLEYGFDQCGGNITNSTIISSPIADESGFYPNEMNCYWNISAASYQKIVVKFEYIEFEGTSGCVFDFIEVYAGKIAHEDRRLARLCGNITGRHTDIIIKESYGIIHAHSDFSNNMRGFRAAIILRTQCDETISLTDANNIYEYNKYSNSITPDTDCNIVVTATSGYHIQITFDTFTVPSCTVNSNDSCSCNYVEVYDGRGQFSDKIGRYCSSSMPPQSVVTSTLSAFIRVVNDPILKITGLKMRFCRIMSMCGKSEYDFNNSSSITIQSPSEGGAYLPNVRCLWKIKNDGFMHLHFEKFDLQGFDTNEKCSNDFVQIITKESFRNTLDGFENRSVILGEDNYYARDDYAARYEFCGNHTPSDFYSSSTVYVMFKSDAEIQKTGFKLSGTIIKDCFKNYTNIQGRISGSPNSDCEFFILLPENYTISLYFQTSYAYDNNCNSQNMKIYDNKSNKLIREICGNIDPTYSVFSNTNQLKVQLHYSDAANYDVTYVGTKNGPGCGGQLYNHYGIFTSPFYPSNDRNNSDCRWDIRVPNNLRVALLFNVFDLGSKVTCSSDYLQIIEYGDNKREQVARQYCGEDTPQKYKSQKDYITVKFRKTVNYDGTGWVISFKGVHDDTDLEKLDWS